MQPLYEWSQAATWYYSINRLRVFPTFLKKVAMLDMIWAMKSNMLAWILLRLKKIRFHWLLAQLVGTVEEVGKSSNRWSSGVVDLVVSLVMQVIVEGVFRRSRCRRFVSWYSSSFPDRRLSTSFSVIGGLVRLCLSKFIWLYLGCSSHPLRCRLLRGGNLFSRPLSSASSNSN